MTFSTMLRKSLGFLLNTGATLSAGFLTFAGTVFIVSSYAVLGLAAFGLVVAYESQVNGEGIAEALRRIFGKDYLELGLVEQMLEDIIADDANMHQGNLFLQDYKDQRIYVRKQKKYLVHLHKCKKMLPAYDTEAYFALDKKIAEEEQKLKYAEKRLLRMRQLLLENLRNPVRGIAQPSLLQQSITSLLCDPKAQDWNNKVFYRKSWLGLTKILSLGVATSAALATYSSMTSAVVSISTIKLGALSLAALSAVPGGVIISLSILAGIGYALLIYGTIADMVQKFNDKWDENFYRRKDKNGRYTESKLKYGFRITFTVVAIMLGVFATLATAGTWWTVVKNGATILGAIESFANTLRSITIGMLCFPSLAYSAQTSIQSVDKIFRSQYGQILVDLKTDIASVWEGWSIAKIIRFINPLRVAANIVSGLGKSVLFIGHLIGVGLGEDNLWGIPPIATASLTATSEGLSDASFLPDEEDDEHTHESWLLTALFFPISVSVFTLKFLGGLWEWGFSGFANFSKSMQKMFGTTPPKMPAPERPKLSSEWGKHEASTVLQENIGRLALTNNAQRKVDIYEQLKAKVNPNASVNVNAEEIRLLLGNDELLKHRHAFSQKLTDSKSKYINLFWNKEQPRSHRIVTDVMHGYLNPRINS